MQDGQTHIEQDEWTNMSDYTDPKYIHGLINKAKQKTNWKQNNVVKQFLDKVKQF